MSVPDFRDALSSFKQSVSEKYRRFVGWTGYRRKKNYLKRKYRVYKDYFKSKLSEYGNVYGSYVVFEFLPNTLAHGLLFNVPAAFFFGFALTPVSVVAFGFGWYIGFILLPDAVQDAIPRVNVKVDN